MLLFVWYDLGIHKTNQSLILTFLAKRLTKDEAGRIF
jgi:hypothetical protein